MKSIEDKLNSVLKGPFKISEAGVGYDDADDGDIGREQEITKDRRVKINTLWTNYLSGLARFEKAKNEAITLGLSAKFRDIITRAIGRSPSSISRDNPLTINEVQSIVIALASDKFDQQLHARRRQLESPMLGEYPPEVAKAVDTLKKDVESSGPLTIMKLMNPRSLQTLTTKKRKDDPHEKESQDIPINIRYVDPDDPKNIHTVTFSNLRSIADQYKDLLHVLKLKNRTDLMQKFLETYQARIQLAKHYWPRLEDAQHQYMAAFYTIRSIASDFTKTDPISKHK